MSEPQFISRHLLYIKPGFIYDEANPRYTFLIPVDSGNFYLCDCWIVDRNGNKHPGYSVCPVPIRTEGMIAVADVDAEES